MHPIGSCIEMRGCCFPSFDTLCTLPNLAHLNLGSPQDRTLSVTTINYFNGGYHQTCRMGKLNYINVCLKMGIRRIEN